MAGRVSAGASALPFIARSTDSVRASVRAVSTGVSDTFVSVGQATDVLSSAQRNYENASLWLAANDTTVRSSDVYRARLAALDQMMTASRAALRDHRGRWSAGRSAGCRRHGSTGVGRARLTGRRATGNGASAVGHRRQCEVFIGSHVVLDLAKAKRTQVTVVARSMAMASMGIKK